MLTVIPGASAPKGDDVTLGGALLKVEPAGEGAEEFDGVGVEETTGAAAVEFGTVEPEGVEFVPAVLDAVGAPAVRAPLNPAMIG